MCLKGSPKGDLLSLQQYGHCLIVITALLNARLGGAVECPKQGPDTDAMPVGCPSGGHRGWTPLLRFKQIFLSFGLLGVFCQPTTDFSAINFSSWLDSIFFRTLVGPQFW